MIVETPNVTKIFVYFLITLLYLKFDRREIEHLDRKLEVKRKENFEKCFIEMVISQEEILKYFGFKNSQKN